eukprot:580952-Pyramimonas_sp.AAC.1
MNVMVDAWFHEMTGTMYQRMLSCLKRTSKARARTLDGHAMDHGRERSPRRWKGRTTEERHAGSELMRQLLRLYASCQLNAKELCTAC